MSELFTGIFKTSIRTIKFRSVLWIILISVFLCKVAFAAQPPHIFMPRGEGAFPLNVHMDYLEDPNNTFTIEQVASGQVGEFKPLTKKNYQFSYTSRAFWVRFVADLSNYNEFYWFLIQNYEHVGAMDVFFTDADGKFDSVNFVENIEPSKRQVNIHQYLFKLPVVSKQQTTYYVKYVPDGHSLSIDLSWASSKGVLESISNVQIGLGLFFGGLAVMWAYNFFLYFFLRDRTYLYYLYYLGTFIAVYTYITGVASLFIQYSTLVQQFFAACAYASVHGMILFARQFLNLRTALPRLNVYLVILQWVLFSGIVLCFFLPTSKTFDWINYLILGVIPALAICGGIRAYQRYQPAYFYFTGWTVLGVGLALQALRSIAVVPSNFVTNYAIQIAAVLEAILFALALANRMRLLEKEKLDKSNQLLLELEKAVYREKEALKQKTLFIAAVNHELRTPLQSLTGSIELLAHQAKSTPMEKYVDKISRASDQIIAQMRDIGEYSRLETGALTQRDVNFQLSELLNGVLDDFNKMAASKGISLVLTGDSKLQELNGDYDRIKQILNNLIYNAIKFTDNGSVTIDAHLALNPDQQLTGKSYLLNIMITDTGIGIAKENLQKIYDVFTQVGDVTKNRGTGLGLAIVKRIVALLNADIFVESEVDKGTQFVVRIPVNKLEEKVLNGQIN